MNNNNMGIKVVSVTVAIKDSLHLYNNICYNNGGNNIDIRSTSITTWLDAYIKNNNYNNLNYSNLSCLDLTDNIQGRYPDFEDSYIGNFQLRSSSPCIDAGKNINYTSFGFPELDSIVQKIRDIGAIESGKIEDLSESGYITLSDNNLTIGQETEITITKLNRITSTTIHIKAQILDIRGRIVSTLMNSDVSAKADVTLKWGGKNIKNEYVGAGIYLLKVYMGTIHETKKIFFIP